MLRLSPPTILSNNNDKMEERVKEILEKSAKEAEKYKPVTVSKLLDLDYDLGNILAIDTNDLDQKSLREKRNDYLLNLTRDNVQLLFNKIWELPTERVEDALMVRLPPAKFVLPRARPVPKPREPTKWEQFAKLKGIQKKKKAKLSWDEQLSRWVPLYGYKRALANKEKDWVLEVPDNADPMEDQFAKKKVSKGERISKNELQRLRNIAKARNVKVPRVGLLNPDVSSAKELQTALTVTRSSTANLGKFQDKLPKEKDARGVADITPGTTRKRKMPMVSAAEEQNKNLQIIDSILNKRPKLDTEKAVTLKLDKEQAKKSSKSQKKKSSKSEKKAHQRRGKKGGGSGRKRR